MRNAAILVLLECAAASCRAETPSSPSDGTPFEQLAQEVAKDPLQWILHWNIETRTLGGRQFWGDKVFYSGWRIQHNVATGHYRLLDAEDVRRAWGTEDECRDALERFKQSEGLKPMTGRAVVLVHGIGRSPKSMGALAERFEKEGAVVVGFGYPSTRISIGESAAYLAEVLQSLEGIEQIDLVTHSMGGLLVRAYLHDQGDRADPRLHRLVMLGTPNQGAHMANLLRTNKMYEWILGPSGQQLVEGPEEYIDSLPVPPFEFGIIAGARSSPGGWNPLVPGDDDGTVSVECTKLPGAADFITVRALHTVLMSHAETLDSAARFLRIGAFRESGDRQPLRKDSAP